MRKERRPAKGGKWADTAVQIMDKGRNNAGCKKERKNGHEDELQATLFTNQRRRIAERIASIHKSYEHGEKNIRKIRCKKNRAPVEERHAAYKRMGVLYDCPIHALISADKGHQTQNARALYRLRQATLMTSANRAIARVDDLHLTRNKATEQFRIFVIDIMHVLRAEEALDFFHK